MLVRALSYQDAAAFWQTSCWSDMDWQRGRAPFTSDGHYAEPASLMAYAAYFWGFYSDGQLTAVISGHQSEPGAFRIRGFHALGRTANLARRVLIATAEQMGRVRGLRLAWQVAPGGSKIHRALTQLGYHQSVRFDGGHAHAATPGSLFVYTKEL